MRIFIDQDYRCHVESAPGLRAVEVPFFDGKCAAFIDGYRYVPPGEIWRREDNEVFEGEFVSPVDSYDTLDAAQRADERQALALLGAKDVQAPSVLAAAARLTMNRLGQSIADENAYDYYEIYPLWQEDMDYHAETGGRNADRVRYRDEDCLFKCRQDHTSTEAWNPLEAPALWSRITESHQGTEEDPIPAGLNMVYCKNLYYSEEQGLYRCIRDSEIELQHLPHQLEGIYFTKVS